MLMGTPAEIDIVGPCLTVWDSGMRSQMDLIVYRVSSKVQPCTRTDHEEKRVYNKDPDNEK